MEELKYGSTLIYPSATPKAATFQIKSPIFINHKDWKNKWSTKSSPWSKPIPPKMQTPPWLSL